MENSMPPINWKKWIESFACVAVIAAAAVAVFAPLLRDNVVPMDLHTVLSAPPWQEARPLGEVRTSDAATWSHARQYYPWYSWLNQGGSMLWNPNEGLGLPVLAAWQTRALSPFTLPVYFLPLHAALVLSALLKVFAAGAAAYYIARRFGFPPATALIAGVSYGFSAPVFLWSAAPLSDAAVWLPLLVVFAERIVLGQWGAWPLGALVLALIALGGDPQALLMCCLLLLVYIPVRCVVDGRARTMPIVLGSALLAAVLGLGLAGAQLIPYYEWTKQGSTEIGPLAGLRLGDIFALYQPGAATGPGHTAPTLAGLLHVGLVSLLLVPIWFSIRPYMEPNRRGRVEALAGIAALLTSIAWLGGSHVAALRLIDGPGPEHFLLFNAVAFSLLAATVAQEWLDLSIDEMREALSRAALRVTVAWGAVFALTAVYLAIRGGGGWGAFGLGLAVGLALFFLLAYTVFRPNAKVLGYGLSLLSAFSLVAAFAPILPRTTAAMAFPETSVVKSLQAIGGRVGGSESLKEWPLAVNGVAQVFQSSGLQLNRFQEFSARLHVDPLLIRRTGANGLLLTKEDIRGPFAAIRPVLRIQQVFPSGAILFQDTEAQPRARMIYAGRRFEKYSPAEVGSQKTPVLESSTLPEKDDGPVANVTIVENTPTRIALKVAKTRPGVLVVANAWYPGWRAVVDGVGDEVVRVDGLFCGVEVGEGEHEVLLEYRPNSLRLGIALSVVSALLIGIGLWRFLAGLFPRQAVAPTH